MSRDSVKTAEEKLAILLEGLRANSNIAELCRRHGISQAIYYKWRDKFFEGGKNALTSNGRTPNSMPEKVKIAELERVIGQQTIEIQVLKKNLKLR